MSLDAALGIAGSGLLAVQRALAQTGQNVSNANTAGYTAKTLPMQALYGGGQPMGVQGGEAQRAVDAALQAQMGNATADQAGAALREAVLQGVEGAYGSVAGPDGASSLADDMGALRSAFITLQASPEDAAAQRAAVAVGGKVAQDFNSVGAAIGKARQQAQDAIGTQVNVINGALRQIGGLNAQIRAATLAGAGTADLADSRDQAVQTLSAALRITTVQQPDGSLLVMSQGGVVLPTDPNQDALSTAPANVAPPAYHGGAGVLPGVFLQGQDVTGQLSGGRLGAATTLRDTTLPRFQAELDNAAGSLAFRFDQQGLTLFTGPTGAVPNMALGYLASGALGFANQIQLNPAVAANPALVRDGDHATGGFTPNPVGGPSGFSALVDNVVNNSFGPQLAAGVPWPSPATNGLGPDGSLASPFNAPPLLQDYAATVQATQTQDRAAASTVKDSAAGLLASLQQRFNTQAGVNVDTEMTNMIRLQQAYAANAKVMSTVQSMWDTLLGAVA